MTTSAHKTEGVNRTKIVRVYPFVSTGNDPRKGWRIPLNEIKYNEQRNVETCYGYCDDYQPHAAVDEKYFSYYVYDHSGGSCASREQSQACLSYAEMEQRRRSQRRLKLVGDNSSMDVCQRLRTPQNKLNEVSNADLMATYTVLNNPTLYPSAYMVLTNKGYTNVTEVESRASSLALPRCSNVTERKHYYAGTDLCASREQSQACLSYAETKQSVRSNRVAARLGGGGLDAQQHVIAIDDELQWKADKLFKQSLDHVNHRVLNENNLNCIMHNEFARDEFGKRIDGIPYQVRSDVETDYWQFKEMVNSMLDDPNNGHEKEVFFYHSDLCGSRAQSQTCLSYAEMQQSVQSNHLGSASWITDYRGKAVQHIQYLPYGEPYINQRPFGYSERFTFTGKERDEETGYGYFGARYMDHELMTMWLSVDPMADKYPSISPYAYCAWNPVKLVDPDGREWDPSALTQEQQNKLNNSVAILCERSPMFKEVYNTLTESDDVVYKLQMGPTQDDVPAQYDNSDKSITFRDEAALESYSAFVEEMVHAYQHSENYCEYDASLDFNYEFEAKLIKYIILDGAMGIPGGMENMLLGIMVTDYKCGLDLDYDKATSPAFQSAYKKEANDYAVYNRNNKIGNANYSKATDQDPATLNLLLKLVRP